MEDDRIIQKAFDENWILITNDKDFGEKVYRERQPHRGIVLLRLDDERSGSKIDALRSLLRDHAERIPGSYVVVTETRVRFARG
jgi:predicted nuclease of predicted toxin-antitoxin system